MVENADWLSDYALFRALMEENGGPPAWDRWPPEHRDPHAAHTWLLSLPENRRERVDAQAAFLRLRAMDRLRPMAGAESLRRRAKTVFLMGDIPFGVGRYSADVWANRAHL